jgi:hypothetical protein
VYPERAVDIVQLDVMGLPEDDDALLEAAAATGEAAGARGAAEEEAAEGGEGGQAGGGGEEAKEAEEAEEEDERASKRARGGEGGAPLSEEMAVADAEPIPSSTAQPSAVEMEAN